MKKLISLLLFTVMLAMPALILTGCTAKNENNDTDVIYEDMRAEFEQSGLMSANIGIFSKTEADGTVTYGECGSGAIIEKSGGMFYVLTAAHVVSDENAQLLVFTVNTEMKSEVIPGLEDMNVLSAEVYDTMYPAEAVYISERDDLAVIRFHCEEELAVYGIAASDAVKGDRIMCIGNPRNDWFAISYGEVTSGLQHFGELKGYPTYGMTHSACIQVGSSGGAAVNAEMKLAGITPGAVLSLDGKTFEYGVMIPVSEINLCIDEWKAQ